MTTPTKTWGEAFDYTWKVKWRRMASAKTNQINAGHITTYAGRSLPLSRMGKAGWWMELISDLQDEGRNSSTINRIISAGTTVMRFTRLAGLHDVAVPQFQRLKEGEHRMTYFTKEQVQQMAFVAVDIFDRKDLADAIVFAAYTGVRQGELLKLRSEDVDLGLSRIFVGGKPGRETKGKNVRAIPIHNLVAPIVTDRLDRKLLFGDDWANKDQLYAAFKKVRKYCGINEDHVWHSLRHSFGTFLGEVTHPRQIMALMGHANIETSLRYVKATDEATRSAVMAI
ncbi:integrase [Synechococcus phage S-CBP42]|uniref:Integrase n=1 Tax=Synechococcus phage S-CBP42 TaxID=461711 RepID=G8EYF8_9CAUD|nr:integrase [Synechococcus phage S-CBP42]AET72538.1 integrase [Synechococcus phage S-CBP42]AGK86695.1 integrase [Synechococcus phage S-CBP42]